MVTDVVCLCPKGQLTALEVGIGKTEPFLNREIVLLVTRLQEAVA